MEQLKYEWLFWRLVQICLNTENKLSLAPKYYRDLNFHVRNDIYHLTPVFLCVHFTGGLVKYVSHRVKIWGRTFKDSAALMLDVLKSNIKTLAEVQKKWKDNEYLWFTKALKNAPH